MSVIFIQAGVVSTSPQFKTSGQGNLYAEFGIEFKSKAYRCMAFRHLVEELKKVERGMSVNASIKKLKGGDAYCIEAISVPKVTKEVRAINYKVATIPKTPMEIFCDKLGAAYVTVRCREFIRGRPLLSTKGSGLTKVGNGFDIEGYKQLVKTLQAETDAIPKV